MIRTCLFLLAITWALPSQAQKSPLKAGDISLQELKMTKYDKDTSAAAVILLDYGEAYISLTTVSAVMNYERHVRIKILKKEGLRWADAFIPLYHSGSEEESVSGLKASTYNLEDGKIVETKMSKDAVFKEKFNKYFNHQKFTLPNVKEGSVIEYTYKVTSDFFTNFPNWQFQKRIPIAHSEFWAVIPDYFIYEKYMQGYLQASYEVKDQRSLNTNAKAHHWTMKDVPAFREEPFMTCEDDYVSKINFALSHINFPGQPVREIMGSWSKLNKLLLDYESFGKTVTGSGFLKKQVEQITAGLTTPEQKMHAIFNYVKENIEWNGTKDYLADNLKKVLEAKRGTSGDINLALASMLEKADIPVDMVMLSTRDHGFIWQQYPMERQFNYVICKVDIGDNTYLLDATEKLLPLGVLPERCLNGEGMVVSETKHGWIRLDTKVRARTVVNAALDLSEEGEFKGKLEFSHEGYDALYSRKEYFEKGEEKYVKDFFSTKSWLVDGPEILNTKEVEKPLKETYDVTISEHVMKAGDVMYIDPFILSKLNENPFKSDIREYPVDFGRPDDDIYMCQIVIPEGYRVDELPAPKIIALPGNAARYTYNVSHLGNKISVTSSLQINKVLFVQDEYPNLREFYNQVVAKHAEQIVLKKN